ncbi:MAG: cytochrome b/b6 domain-containing protein [Alphaproteobacteria bacterium]|nr:cytochrome b/b6 domain-containing protein [Alphaproteobacteria bacterium]
MYKILIWDKATRLFHWLLVFLFIGAVVTVKTGRIEAHAILGSLMAGLLFFRLLAGLFGAQTLRFSEFFKPQYVFAYLKGKYHTIGHNPLGALMVVAMLLLLVAHIIFGLFSNDSILFEGAFAPLISRDLSDTLTYFHSISAKILIAMVFIHIAVILYYHFIKKQNLTAAMIHGKATYQQKPEKLPYFVPVWRYIIFLILGFSLSIWLILLHS